MDVLHRRQVLTEFLLHHLCPFSDGVFVLLSKALGAFWVVFLYRGPLLIGNLWPNIL